MSAADRRPTPRSTTLYISAVVLLWAVLITSCYVWDGLPSDWTGLLLLCLLGSLTWWLPTSSDGRSVFTADNVVVLTAIPVVGVLGGGIVGFVMTGLTTRRIPMRRRVFNMAMTSACAMIGGLAYVWAGGSLNPSELSGGADLLWHVGVPIVIADIVNLAVNAVLVAGVIHIADGVPVRLQLVDMLTSSALTQFAYGIIAFLVVIMWRPGGLGPVSVIIALAPLAGARWALLLYGEERTARERALDALVAAVETRDPSLEGHSGRVSDLAARMASDLGLGPREVADVRTAGLLHDLGRVVVAPGTSSVDSPTAASAVAERGAAMVRDLPFLSGASRIMSDVALPGGAPSLSAVIVRLADEYDLMVSGVPAVDSQTALVRLYGEAAAGDARALAALSRSIGIGHPHGEEVA